jgi:hypothetical protein
VPSTKLQASTKGPSTKLQTSTKSQALSTKRLELEDWKLGVVWNLEFGAWDLEFGV